MKNYSKFSFALWGIIVLLLVNSAYAVVSEADIIFLKQKIESGQTLSQSDILLAREINATTQSFIDLNQLLNPQQSTPSRPERNPLDDYMLIDNTYEWVDISTNGTNTGLSGDDQNMGPFNLGFNFSFYNTTFNSVRVCSNGFLSFTSTNSPWTETIIPSAAEPNNAIYAMWDDLYLPSGGQVLYYADAANQRFIVSYLAVPHIGQPANLYTFQVILYPSGNIVLNYQSLANNNSCLVGVENSTGTEALQVCFDGAGTLPTDEHSFLIGQPDGIPLAPTNLTANFSGGNVTLNWVDPNHDTNNNPITIQNIQVYLGNPSGGGALIATVGAGVQTYTHVNPAQGQLTYYVRGFLNPFPGVPASVTVIVGSPTYNNNFDTDFGIWVADPADGGFSWGPSLGGGTDPAPHSDPNYWGTRITGGYANSSQYMTDLVLGLNVLSPSATMDCWVNYNAENTWDGCNLKVSVDEGATWSVLTPVEGYPVASIQAGNTFIGGQPAWSGNSNGWVHVNFNLGSFVGQIPRFRFDFGSDNIIANLPGFYFDDMIIWGLAAPQTASVSGTISFDGGAGSLAAVQVRANGLGAPQTNPNAGGAYTLAAVQTGNRIITASLANYITNTLNVNVTPAGVTGANITLRRVNPPAPTGLTGSVNNGTGVVTLDWTTSPDALVDVYKVYRKLQDDQNWVLVATVTPSNATDNLTVDGIYQYRVTAVDNNVSTPAESDPSNEITVLYGELPPVNLTADGNFDNHVHLSWLTPGSPPETELFYDNGQNSPNIDGIGFWNNQPPYGWLIARFHGTGPVSVTRIKIFFTGFAMAGDAIQVGVFADSANGLPGFVPLVAVDITQAEPFDDFRIITLPVPVTIASGNFFIGARQMTSNAIAIGGDDTTPFINSTFYYAFTPGTWVAFEPNLMAIPLIRCFAVGDFGLEMMEPSPACGAATAEPLMPTASAQITKISLAKSSASASENSNLGQVTWKENLTKHDIESMFYRRLTSVGPHMANFQAASPDEGRDRNPLDDLLYYIVFRDNVDIGHPTVTNFDSPEAVENVQHTFTVKAHYDNNQDSPPSNAVQRAANMAPGAPTNVALTPQGQNSMRITWTNPTTNRDGSNLVDLAGIKVYRDGTFLANVPVGDGQYVDTPPQNNQRYTWSVKGYDEVPNIGDEASASGAIVSPWQEIDYEWIDISANGTVCAQGDDINEGPFPLGFDITFYGNTYNSVRVCSNGFLSFTSNSSTYIDTPIPSATPPNDALYIYWDDMFPTTGQCKYFQDAANGQFIVSWIDCPHFGGQNNCTFQVIITDNGGVIYNYQHVAPTNSCTIGVENADGTDAIQLLNAGAGDFTPEDNSAIQFWGGPAGELAGTVRVHSSNALLEGVHVWATGWADTAITDAQGAYVLGMDPGTYSVHFERAGYCDTTFANVVVEDGNTTVRNARMLAPTATFNVTSINESRQVGTNFSVNFTITNATGNCPLEYTITDTSAWLNCVPATGNIAPGGNTQITVNILGSQLSAGEHQTQIRVAHGAVNSPYTIPVTVDMTTTAVDDPNGTIPTEFALHQNFPNPFNATTAIRFDLPQQSRMTVKVFNVMGQQVAEIANGEFAAGRHEVLYTASDLTSGMYIVRMDAPSFTAQVKMLLLK